jgi:hypothetical protein
MCSVEVAHHTAVSAWLGVNFFSFSPVVFAARTPLSCGSRRSCFSASSSGSMMVGVQTSSIWGQCVSDYVVFARDVLNFRRELPYEIKVSQLSRGCFLRSLTKSINQRFVIGLYYEYSAFQRVSEVFDRFVDGE